MIALSPDSALLLVILPAVGAAMTVLGARKSMLQIRTVRCPVCGHVRLSGKCAWCRNR